MNSVTWPNGLPSRVLVTGGRGFIGRQVLGQAAVDGLTAVSFDLPDGPRQKSTGNSLVGDITNRDDVDDAIAIAKPDVIVHCAALVGGAASLVSPLEQVQVNVAGAIVLYDAARAAGVQRVVHISSIDVYGDFEEPIADEAHPTDPRLLYGILKLAVEQIGKASTEAGTLECIELRGSWIFGPGYARNRVPNTLATAIAGLTEVDLASGADSVMDFVHVEDFARATVAAVCLPAHPHRIYNIGSGVAVSLGDLVGELKKRHPEAPIRVGPGEYMLASGLPMSRQGALDITRASEVLGFKPRIDLVDGLLRLAHELRECADPADSAA